MDWVKKVLEKSYFLLVVGPLKKNLLRLPNTECPVFLVQ